MPVLGEAPRADPIELQLLLLTVRYKGAIVAACDRELRYTHLLNPHPDFEVERVLGKRDDEIVPHERVADLMALKQHVLSRGEEIRRRVRILVGEEPHIYDIVAEPIGSDSGRTVGVATAAVDVTPGLRLQGFLRRMSEGLREQSTAMARRWHSDLADRLTIRPRRVFPGKELLDGVPAIIRWLADSVSDGHVLDAGSTDSLRGIASNWRQAGYTVEEALLHVRVLTDILLDALREECLEEGHQLSPADGVEAARRIWRGIDAVEAVIVGVYRDAEGERFTDFGDTLAHEIRDHLNAARSGLQVIQVLDEDDGSDAQRRAELMDRVEHALDRAASVVTAVRSLSSAGEGPHHEWDRRSLRAIVDEVVEEHGAEDGRGTRIFAAEDIPDVLVPDDPVHLVLHNLVENAVKYADPDAEDRWVRIHCERSPEDGRLTVHVGDNGLGIPEDEQKRIFLRFRRGRQATGDGFGLGLAIVRETAQKFGGRVLLESEPGHGSTFSFTIPADRLTGE